MDLNTCIEGKERLNKADSTVRENLMDQFATLNHYEKVVTDTDSIDVGKLLYEGGLNKETGLPNYAVAQIDGGQTIKLDVSNDGVLQYEGYDKAASRFEIKTLWKATKINPFKTIRAMPMYLCIVLIIASLVAIFVDEIAFLDNLFGPSMLGLMLGVVWGSRKRVYRVEGKKIALPCKINISNYVFDHLGLELNKDYIVIFPFDTIQRGESPILQVVTIGSEKFFIPFSPKKAEVTV